MDNPTFNYLELDQMEQLRFRDNLLSLYLPYYTLESLNQLLEHDRDQYIEQQNYEIAKAYQDLLNDLKLLDELA
jgi:hypothetical protein